MLAQCLQCWFSINTTLVRRLVFGAWKVVLRLYMLGLWIRQKNSISVIFWILRCYLMEHTLMFVIGNVLRCQAFSSSCLLARNFARILGFVEWIVLKEDNSNVFFSLVIRCMDYTNICICTSGGMVSVTSLSTTHRILCFLIFLLCFLKLCHGIQTETLHDSSREYDLDTATGNTFSKGNTENTRHRPNVGPTLGQRGRWCFNTGPTLGQCLVYAGKHGRIFHCVKYSAGKQK